MKQDIFPTADEQTGELLTTIGHEFGGPLTTIQGYATTLLRHEQHLTAQERQAFLHAISEATAQLRTLVERLLTLAQVENQGHTLTLAPVNLLALVHEAIAAGHDKQPHASFVVASPAGSAPWTEDSDEAASPHALILWGDAHLLRTMLDMVLENAVAYAEPDAQVEVSLEALDGTAAQAALRAPPGPGAAREVIVAAPVLPEHCLVALRVHDHGIGIAPEHLRLIFQRFYRVDTSLTRKVYGLGLGLALCQAIVQLHQGMLWLESAVGTGTTVTIMLPCDRLTCTANT